MDEKGHLFGVRGGSGGFAESIFKYAAETLFGKVLEGPLNFRTLRNPDFTEISLEVFFFFSCLIVEVSLKNPFFLSPPTRLMGKRF